MNPIRVIFLSSFTATINKKHSKTTSIWQALASCAYIFSMFLIAVIIKVADITGNSDLLFKGDGMLKPLFIITYVSVLILLYWFYVKSERLEQGIKQFEEHSLKKHSLLISVSSLVIVSLLFLIVAITG